MSAGNAAAWLLRPRLCGNARLRESRRGALDVEIEADPLTGTCQWFHFGVRAEIPTRVRIVDAGSSTYPRGWRDGIVWTRAGGGPWRPFRAAAEDGVLALPDAVPGVTVLYALFPPYPLRRLDALRERVRAGIGGEVVEAGRTLRLGIGDPDRSARQVWIVCGQHGGEHPAIWFADGLVDALLTKSRLPAGRRFNVVPVANLAGMKAGHLRTTPEGQDPNRGWGEGGGGHDCPEVDALLEAMASTGVDVLLDVHTDFEMGCVYLDVLDEWMETPARLAAVRAGFERALAGRSPDVAAGRRYPWPAAPPASLLAGMCAPAIERRFGAAAMTLELPCGAYRDAAERQRVWTPARSRALGRAVAAILSDEAGAALPDGPSRFDEASGIDSISTGGSVLHGSE